jgi:transposase
MSGVIKIEILETVDELRELLKSTQSREVTERVQALYWLKSGQVQTTKAIANLIGKHRVTVSRWLSSYKAQGINALLNPGKSSGRNKKLSPSVEASLRQELIDEQGFSSYKEIQIIALKSIRLNDCPKGYRFAYGKKSKSILNGNCLIASIA